MLACPASRRLPYLRAFQAPTSPAHSPHHRRTGRNQLPADVNSLPAFDEAAAQEHAPSSTRAVRALNAALLDGSPLAFWNPCCLRAPFCLHQKLPSSRTHGHMQPCILWDSENTLRKRFCTLMSSRVVLGVGCRRGVKPQELPRRGTVSFEFGLNAENIASIFTCTVKEDEPAILGLGEAWRVR
ncbi:MAG: cobalamin biosynthesis protein [Bilophila wadsworthia]